MSTDRHQLAPCGTRSAYNRHRRHGEAACDACKAANAIYRREQYTKNPESYARSMARLRALYMLGKNHAPDFAAAYAIARAEVQAEDGTPHQKVQRARGRAHQAVARLYPTEFIELVDAEYAKLDQQAVVS